MKRRKFIQNASIATLGVSTNVGFASELFHEEVIIRRFLLRLAGKLLFNWATDSISDNYREEKNEYNSSVSSTVRAENSTLESQGYKPHRERMAKKKEPYRGFYYDSRDRDFFYPMYRSGHDVRDYRVPFFSVRPRSYGHCTTLFTPEVGALSEFCSMLGQDYQHSLFKPMVYPRNMYKRKTRRNKQKNGSAVLYFTDCGEVAVSYSRNGLGRWKTQFDYLPYEINRSSRVLKHKPLSESYYLEY